MHPAVNHDRLVFSPADERRPKLKKPHCPAISIVNAVLGIAG
jgi:hypothetical protein